MGLFYFLLIYTYVAYSMQTIANRVNIEDTWHAWVPIANVILMCKIAKKPSWWVLLIFIPIVNAVIAVILWMGIAEACGKPKWLGLLLLVPVANFILPGYLAFTK